MPNTKEGDIQRFEDRFTILEEFGNVELLPLLKNSLRDLQESAYGCLILEPSR